MQTGAAATIRSMPLTLFEPTAQPIFDEKERLAYWTYRIGAYLLINVVDDPAWLALMFC